MPYFSGDVWDYRPDPSSALHTHGELASHRSQKLKGCSVSMGCQCHCIHSNSMSSLLLLKIQYFPLQVRGSMSWWDSSVSASLKPYIHEFSSLERLLLGWAGWICASWGAWSAGALAQLIDPCPVVLRAQLWLTGLRRDGEKEICLCVLEFGLINDLIYNPKWSCAFCYVACQCRY